jgi:hypothetical protein
VVVWQLIAQPVRPLTPLRDGQDRNGFATAHMEFGVGPEAQAMAAVCRSLLHYIPERNYPIATAPLSCGKKDDRAADR